MLTVERQSTGLETLLSEVERQLHRAARPTGGLQMFGLLRGQCQIHRRNMQPKQSFDTFSPVLSRKPNFMLFWLGSALHSDA